MLPAAGGDRRAGRGLACRNLTDAMLEELEQELQASAEANIKGDTAAIITHDTRFHELIIDAADNEYIAEISHMLVLHIQRIRYHFFHLPTMRRISASQHRGDPGRPAGKGTRSGPRRSCASTGSRR